MVEGGHRDATGCFAPTPAPSSLFVSMMSKNLGWCNICLTASPTLRGPSTEVKRVKMAIFHHFLVGHMFDHSDPF